MGKGASEQSHPRDVSTCSVDMWRRILLRRNYRESEDRDAKRQAFHRASTQLQELKIIGVWQDHVWLA